MNAHTMLSIEEQNAARLGRVETMLDELLRKGPRGTQANFKRARDIEKMLAGVAGNVDVIKTGVATIDRKVDGLPEAVYSKMEPVKEAVAKISSIALAQGKMNEADMAKLLRKVNKLIAGQKSITSSIMSIGAQLSADELAKAASIDARMDPTPLRSTDPETGAGQTELPEYTAARVAQATDEAAEALIAAAAQYPEEDFAEAKTDGPAEHGPTLGHGIPDIGLPEEGDADDPAGEEMGADASFDDPAGEPDVIAPAQPDMADELDDGIPELKFAAPAWGGEDDLAAQPAEDLGLLDDFEMDGDKPAPAPRETMAEAKACGGRIDWDGTDEEEPAERHPLGLLGKVLDFPENVVRLIPGFRKKAA